MKIKSMTAVFGKLEGTHLELGEGLNLIHAPNEGGKSTWAAFWRAMLYGIDTRDRDKKGRLADKNRWQPWSGAPMEGEINLEWQGRDITIRRGPRGNTPFGAFSAVYTGTEEPVPGLTADTCGSLLTGAGREVFDRSAFIGSGGNLAVTAAPELEKRIAALVSSGEEDVSFSQTQARLKEWLNRRKVNRSVGLIPRLEGELEQVREALDGLEEAAAQIAQLEGERAALEGEKATLTAEREAHRRRAQADLDRRYAQAGEELRAAQAQLTALEGELARFGPRPDKEQLKRAQGELQYLKVLDEEIKQGETALKEEEEAYVQAQIAAQDELFAGLSGEEAVRRAQADVQTLELAGQKQAARKKRAGRLRLACLFLFLLAILLLGAPVFAPVFARFPIPRWLGLVPLAVALLMQAVSFWTWSQGRKVQTDLDRLLARYGAERAEEITALARDYLSRCQAAEEAAQQSRAVRGALNDRKARRDNSRAGLLRFVHAFAPEVRDLFGCSAALSRALNLDHELALAKDRVEERRRRREDLAAQGGQDTASPEALSAPARAPEETEGLLSAASARLEAVNEALNQARGRQKAMGDPAALAARREALDAELDRRREEYDALTLAMSVLAEANARLQERFSPELNRLAGQYMARLTGERYAAVTLTRELEGAAVPAGDVLPRSVLSLSRGTADQLYLAVRLAVCRLCLPDRPPILLDDALAAFDDERLVPALDLLRELGAGQQILLFTCQRREGAALAGAPGVTRLEL